MATAMHQVVSPECRCSRKHACLRVDGGTSLSAVPKGCFTTVNKAEFCIYLARLFLQNRDVARSQDAFTTMLKLNKTCVRPGTRRTLPRQTSASPFHVLLNGFLKYMKTKLYMSLRVNPNGTSPTAFAEIDSHTAPTHPHRKDRA